MHAFYWKCLHSFIKTQWTNRQYFTSQIMRELTNSPEIIPETSLFMLTILNKSTFFTTFDNIFYYFLPVASLRTVSATCWTASSHSSSSSSPPSVTGGGSGTSSTTSSCRATDSCQTSSRWSAERYPLVSCLYSNRRSRGSPRNSTTGRWRSSSMRTLCSSSRRGPIYCYGAEPGTCVSITSSRIPRPGRGCATGSVRWGWCRYKCSTM